MYMCNNFSRRKELYGVRIEMRKCFFKKPFHNEISRMGCLIRADDRLFVLLHGPRQEFQPVPFRLLSVHPIGQLNYTPVDALKNIKAHNESNKTRTS